MTKQWFSFSENGAYTGDEPSFFDISKKSWKTLLEENTEIILEEFKAVHRSRDENIIPYYNRTLADNAENWTIFPLYVWGEKKTGNCLKCPQTTAIAEKIEGMTSCSFSILKPHTRIKPHFGDSNVMYRCHLALKCESGLPGIGMRVRNEMTEWKPGHLFAFCDAHEHEVWNTTDTERWVLIIDILREDVVARKKQICAEVKATFFWQLKFQNTSLLSHLPRRMRKMLVKITAPFM